MSPGEPEGVADGQYPEDGELVQHLADEAQRHVEVHGEETYGEGKGAEGARW